MISKFTRQRKKQATCTAHFSGIAKPMQEADVQEAGTRGVAGVLRPRLCKLPISSWRIAFRRMDETL